MLCYLNGQFLPRSTASIPVEDRGFIFGDGVYEVWRVVNGQLYEFERHLDRVTSGLHDLRIVPPAAVSGAELPGIAKRLLEENGLLEGEGTVYLEVTRGVARRTHQFPSPETAPSVFVMTNPFTPPHELRARGAAAITAPDVRWLRCNIKTVQLLPNVLAQQAASERGATEAVLIRDGVVTEGTHSNVFAVIDGCLRTHPLTNLVLPGITRTLVLDIARTVGIPVREDALGEPELRRVDELFLTGTTTDIMPIVRLDELPVGVGVPGPVTTRLYEEYRARLDAACGSAAAAR